MTLIIDNYNKTDEFPFSTSKSPVRRVEWALNQLTALGGHLTTSDRLSSHSVNPPPISTTSTLLIPGARDSIPLLRRRPCPEATLGPIHARGILRLSDGYSVSPSPPTIRISPRRRGRQLLLTFSHGR